jgi:hypothetical protein
MRHAAYLMVMVQAVLLLGCGKSESNPDEGDDPSGAPCNYDGREYEHGESFAASDGCNRCSCDDGGVACTLVDCQPNCDDIASGYAELMEQIKTCDPAAEQPCRLALTEGLACGCGTFGNPAASAAAAELMDLQEQYTEQGCGAGVVCGPCNAPIGAHCTDEGQCEDDYQPACKVGGKVYGSGSTGIQDPFSCNQCTCDAGVLSCTDLACDMACPPNAVPGQSCAACGPVDECLVVEHACLHVCDTSCANGASCVQGVCRSICG